MQSQMEAARRQWKISDAADATLRQASDAIEDLVEELATFEESIDPAEEARIVIIGGPAGTTLFPSTIGALGHDRIRFEGVDQEGAKVVVIQHVSQFNVMLKATKVGKNQARRIGFHSLEGEEPAPTDR
ncbi:hypothetical protein [Sphingomonas sp. IW22]|uniref:hypothetical protein n=1 Tax=Sphingomonas sp. IW22 TaxID=3242489 RepID=UPI00352215C3